jgi:hypothetical protein
MNSVRNSLTVPKSLIWKQVRISIIDHKSYIMASSRVNLHPVMCGSQTHSWNIMHSWILMKKSSYEHLFIWLISRRTIKRIQIESLCSRYQRYLVIVGSSPFWMIGVHEYGNIRYLVPLSDWKKNFTFRSWVIVIIFVQMYMERLQSVPYPPWASQH